MRAYKAWWDYGDGSTVVFTETRNQAKVIALSCDCCTGLTALWCTVEDCKFYKPKEDA